MEVVLRRDSEDEEEAKEPLVLRSFDSDSLLAERQARALNVTQHLYFLLKSRQWAEFEKTLWSYVSLVKGGKDTLILQVPLEVPHRTRILPSDRRLEDLVTKEFKTKDLKTTDGLVVTAGPSSQGVVVAVKLQAVVKGSPEDEELAKEASYFQHGTLAVREGICAHFPLMMAHIVYDQEGSSSSSSTPSSTPSSSPNGMTTSTRWHALVNEWADGDLGFLFENHRLPSDPHAIHPLHRHGTLQAMMGLYVMNHLWDVYHNDLHPKNVLFVYLPTPTTFVYDLPSLKAEDSKKWRVTLRSVSILCLIWDFSKVDPEAELGSNDFYEFFSQGADVHPALVSEVKSLTSYSPLETKRILPWLLDLVKGWALTDSSISLEVIDSEELELKPLPHPCVYSSMIA